MKNWKKLVLTCILGTGISLGIGGIILPTFNLIPIAYAAETVPMEDTWILSDGAVQYYLKGGTLQFNRPTQAMRESGAYSFRAKIVCVYPNGSYTIHQYRMSSKGAICVSIDGGPIMVVDSNSIYAQIYNVICNTYVI